MLMIVLGTVEGAKIELLNINIVPCQSATITYKLHTKSGEEKLTHTVEGEQYARWGTDDTIIYHILCAKHKLHYKPYEEPEFFQELMVWKDEETGEMKSEVIRYPNPKYDPNATAEYKPMEYSTSGNMASVYEENRSIHNEADLQKINNLQSQLEDQKAKLEQINKLLLARGIL